jgi:RNA polymerase sigma factor (sigma-70 family)
MTEKEDEGEHGLKEEAEHSANQDNDGELQEEDYENPTADEKDEQIIDNQEPDVLEQEVQTYWGDPDFVKLMNDPEFLDTLEEICEGVMSSFKPSRTYSCKDLNQDVLIRFGKWLPQYRRDASWKTVLRRIAQNQLIDVYRSWNERCPSYEDLLESFQVDATQNALAVGDSMLVKEPLYSTIRQALRGIEFNILAEELSSKLSSRKERQLFHDYFIEDKSATEIARERGVSRQAVSKQIDRLIEKLRPYVN